MPQVLDRPTDQPVRKPALRGTLFVITVDTEPDDAWTNHQNPSVKNVASLLRLRALLERYDARATLLITTRVVEDDDACAALEACIRGGDEIGAHLHPWESPPFLPSGLDTRYAAFPHELPLNLFTSKMKGLTESIGRRFGAPRSYRAGRWGLASEHLRPLEALGYLAETSVIPWIDWRRTAGIPIGSGGRGGADYRRAPRNPYHPSYDDLSRSGEARITELPVTVGFTRRTPGFVYSIYGRIPYLGKRLLRKTELLRPVWATPPEASAHRLERMLRTVLQERPPVINVALHSSELWPGGAPHVCSAADADSVFARLELLLRIAAEDDRCFFTTLSNAAQRWNAAHADRH